MKKLFLFVTLFITAMITAQDVDIQKGDFEFLKNQKALNITFDYSQMKLMEDNKTEADYVATRTKELNDKNKTVGDIWKKKWEGAKEGIWQPKFLELVNVVLAKKDKDLIFQEGLTTAKYTLIVNVVWIYPGWDVFMMKQPAKVSTKFQFVETANKSNVLLEITSEKAPGDQFGNNFSNESRIGEGFAKTGKTLAGFIIKKTK
jgi:sulfatase maturation enzyme AslB (radical SAM superfamily)